MVGGWNLDEPAVRDDSVRVGIIFVRHGESEWNAQSRIQGHRGGGLTSTGKAQARAAAEYICRAYPSSSLVLSSDLHRSVQTAEIYLQHRGVSGELRLDERLREVDNGDWSGRLTTDVAAAEADYILRIRNGEDLRRGGGESLSEAQLRITNFCAETTAALAREDAKSRWAIAFGHGGPIRLAALAALGLPATAVRVLGHCSNTAITEIEYWVRPDGAAPVARLLGYNSAQHVTVGLGGVSVPPAV